MLDTVFSADGSHLISRRPRHDGQADGSRDAAVRRQHHLDHARRPARAGCRPSPATPSATRSSSAVPTACRRSTGSIRQTGRVIGDDANLSARSPPMPGRIFGVAVQHDGKRVAAGSSLDGKGELVVYGYEFDTDVPDNIKAIMAKVAERDRLAAGGESKALDEYPGRRPRRSPADPRSPGTGLRRGLPARTAPRSGRRGRRRHRADVDPAHRRRQAASPSARSSQRRRRRSGVTARLAQAEPARSSPSRRRTVRSRASPVEPAGWSACGTVRRRCSCSSPAASPAAARSISRGVCESSPNPPTSPRSWRSAPGASFGPLADGEADADRPMAGRQAVAASLPVAVAGTADCRRRLRPRRESRALADGLQRGHLPRRRQGQERLQALAPRLRPVFDIRRLTDDLAARRVNLASPDDSLMLLEAHGAVPHVGGRADRARASPTTRSFARWIAGGAKLDLTTPRVAKIEVFPEEPGRSHAVGGRQQMRRRCRPMPTATSAT